MHVGEGRSRHPWKSDHDGWMIKAWLGMCGSLYQGAKKQDGAKGLGLKMLTERNVII